MTTSSPDQLENTRKTSAKIQAEVLQRLALVTGTKAAERMGVSGSTVSRMVTDDLPKVCSLLAAIGMQVASCDSVVIPRADLEALKRMAYRYLEAEMAGKE